MESGYQIGASALNALERWQDAVSSNIAMNAPGGKQSLVAIERVAPEKLKAAKSGQFQELTKATVHKDWSQGAVVRTGNPTDLAIRNDKGFFGFGGGSYFSRDGQFHWSKENVLVNKEGIPVDGDSGQITKSLNGGEIAIDVRGNVFQGGAKINTIAVFNVPTKELHGPSGRLELGKNATPPGKLENAEISTEYLEKPNGSQATYMTDLIKLKHAQDAVGRMISSIDELYARASKYASDI